MIIHSHFFDFAWIPDFQHRYSTSFDERPNAWRLVELEPEAAAALQAGEGLHVKGATKAR